MNISFMGDFIQPNTNWEGGLLGEEKKPDQMCFTDMFAGKSSGLSGKYTSCEKRVIWPQETF